MPKKCQNLDIWKLEMSDDPQPIEIHNSVKLFDFWNEPTKTLELATIDLWSRNKVFADPEIIKQRLKQIVITAVDESGKAVGVSTVVEGLYPQYLPNYFQSDVFYFRMFTDPAARVERLMLKMTNVAFEILEGQKSVHKKTSLVLVGENPKFSRKAAVIGLKRHGYLVVGLNQFNQPIFKKDFRS